MDITKYARSQMTSFVAISDKLGQDIRRHLLHSKVLCCLHITKETGVFALELQKLGIDVSLVASNPLSTKTEVVKELERRKIKIYWSHGDQISMHKVLLRGLRTNPEYIIDDGGELVTLVHSKKVRTIKGACEETTSGIIEEKKLERKNKLQFPVIAVNNSRTKNLMDNHFGTAQSILDGIIRATQEIIAGKNIVVCGYGHCGSGIAKNARALGARVSVTEVDSIKALQAFYDGFNVDISKKIFPFADIIITATGCTSVVNISHIKNLKKNCILANAGHSNVEIDVKLLRKRYKKINSIGEHIEVYRVNKKNIYLLGKGRIINLVAADGHPSEIMSMSYASQLSGLHFLVTNKLENKLHQLPPFYEEEIARQHLRNKQQFVEILDKEQKKYLYG